MVKSEVQFWQKKFKFYVSSSAPNLTWAPWFDLGDLARAKLCKWCGLHLLDYYQPTHLLTHWTRNKMAANLRATFSNTVSCIKIVIFSLTFASKGPIKISQHWFRELLVAECLTGLHLNHDGLVYWGMYVPLGLDGLTCPNLRLHGQLNEPRFPTGVYTKMLKRVIQTMNFR